VTVRAEEMEINTYFLRLFKKSKTSSPYVMFILFFLSATADLNAIAVYLANEQLLPDHP